MRVCAGVCIIMQYRVNNYSFVHFAQKKEALPGLIGGKLDALPWRWCPLSGTRPAPFAGRRSVAALGVVCHTLPADPWPAIFNVPPGEGGPWYFGRSSAPVSQRDEVWGVTPFPWSYYNRGCPVCQPFFQIFSVFFLRENRKPAEPAFDCLQATGRSRCTGNRHWDGALG